MQDIHSKPILIIDFGSQYTQLIARRVRELKVYCEICCASNFAEANRRLNPAGIIISGGPASVNHDFNDELAAEIFAKQIPVLGICYGMQMIAHHFGGEVKMGQQAEYGAAKLNVVANCDLFKEVAANSTVWMSHGDEVVKLPAGFSKVAVSADGLIAAIARENIFAVQFHPEVTHSEFGNKILANFIYNICQASHNWTAANIVEDLITEAREKVGDDKVILGLSGGVDSSVVAALLHQALGDKLTCIFVDTGLLRHNEAQQVIATFSKNLGANLIAIDAKQQFLGNLKGIADPEEKRKIIGRTFIEIFDAESKKIENAKWLAQGTIYPDVIESAGSSKHSKTIKSHHNVGGLPEKMNLQLLEPLRQLFKDEVRLIGEQLGLPHEMVWRHPFPGPGLGVRILGEIKPEYVPILQQADKIFIDTLHQFDYYHKVSQAFAVFLPVKSVGVVGDNRQYEYVIALRAVVTTDFMTATWAPLPHELLQQASSRIINEVKGISRVTYDISSKPPATIEWE